MWWLAFASRVLGWLLVSLGLVGVIAHLYGGRPGTALCMCLFVVAGAAVAMTLGKDGLE